MPRGISWRGRCSSWVRRRWRVRRGRGVSLVMRGSRVRSGRLVRLGLRVRWVPLVRRDRLARLALRVRPRRGRRALTGRRARRVTLVRPDRRVTRDPRARLALRARPGLRVPRARRGRPVRTGTRCSLPWTIRTRWCAGVTTPPRRPRRRRRSPRYFRTGAAPDPTQRNAPPLPWEERGGFVMPYSTTGRSMCRWSTSTPMPAVRRYRAASSAMATDLCRPPRHATVTRTRRCRRSA